MGPPTAAAKHHQDRQQFALLRARDCLAILIGIVLTRLTWFNSQHQEQALSVGIHLSWYLPRHLEQENHPPQHVAANPVTLDINGDGIAETMAVLMGKVQNEHSTEYALQVLDLRPGMTEGMQFSPHPYRPQSLIESAPWHPDPHDGDGSQLEPLIMTTGHVHMFPSDLDHTRRRGRHEEESNKPPEGGGEERTKSYYCGSDWHDAASKCGTPCPGGTSDECPNDERCYADTPCVEILQQKEAEEQAQRNLKGNVDEEILTLRGSRPSIVSLWNNGVLQMHSLVSIPHNPNSHRGYHDTIPLVDSHDSGKKSEHHQDLQLQSVWETSLLFNYTVDYRHWSSYHLEFLDTVTSNIILISGEVGVVNRKVKAAFDEAQRRGDRHATEAQLDELYWVLNFVICVNAKTGQVLWDNLHEMELYEHDGHEEVEEEQAPLLPILPRGESSPNRRRSLNPNLHHQHGSNKGMLSESNCFKSYRRSLLLSNAFPHLLWTSHDAKSHAIHVDYQHGGHQHHPGHHHHHHHHKSSGLQHYTKSAKEAVRTLVGKDPKENAVAASTANNHHHHLKSHHKSKAATSSSTGGGFLRSWWMPKKKKTHSHHHHHATAPAAPVYGRPNVVATHSQDGLRLRSLHNGKTLCHLPLWSETLYSDLNHDGLLDSVNVITGRRQIQSHEDDDYTRKHEPESLDWVDQLVKRVSRHLKDKNATDEIAARKKREAEEDAEEKEEYDDRDEGEPPLEHSLAHLCHIQALSGLPTREELYSVNICGPHFEDDGRHGGLEAAPPLAVEALHRRPSLLQPHGHHHHHHSRTIHTQDIVAAVSQGIVTRIDGMTGHILWQHKGHLMREFPHWRDDSRVVLDRVRSPGMKRASRPILLSGENSLAILAATDGELLDIKPFPQRVVERPWLIDINGDGTFDMVVPTADAYWAYAIHVTPQATPQARVAVGLLLLCLMLAVLRNRFGPQPGKRSTDK